MATPIEANTEGLQEILQTVYNLPMAGGGSAEPDLVLNITLPSTKQLSGISTSDVTIKSGSVANTYAKLQNREEVKVYAECDYYYGASVVKFTGIFYPSLVCMAYIEGSNSLAVNFLGSRFPGYPYEVEHVCIMLDLDETVRSAGCY